MSTTLFVSTASTPPSTPTAIASRPARTAPWRGCATSTHAATTGIATAVTTSQPQRRPVAHPVVRLAEDLEHRQRHGQHQAGADRRAAAAGDEQDARSTAARTAGTSRGSAGRRVPTRGRARRPATRNPAAFPSVAASHCRSRSRRTMNRPPRASASDDRAAARCWPTVEAAKASADASASTMASARCTSYSLLHSYRDVSGRRWAYGIGWAKPTQSSGSDMDERACCATRTGQARDLGPRVEAERRARPRTRTSRVRGDLDRQLTGRRVDHRAEVACGHRSSRRRHRHRQHLDR